VKSESQVSLARRIPPQIADAVAGMEFVGAELVDRKQILQAIEVFKGESLADRLTSEATQILLESNQKINDFINQSTLKNLSKEIGLSGAKALSNVSFHPEVLAKVTKSFENSAAKAMMDSVKTSQEMVSKVMIDTSALAKLAASFENSGAKAIMDSAKISQELMSKIMIDTSALAKLAASFENSAAKAMMDSVKTSQEMVSKAMIDTSALAKLAASFENSAAKAMMDSVKTSQEMVSKIIAEGVSKSLKWESQRLDKTIRQLGKSGWLVPTSSRGYWEFAPGSRAGSISTNAPFQPLLARLSKNPELSIAVTMESAAFIHQLSEHPPRKGVIAVPKGTSRKGSLGKYRHVNIQLPQCAIVLIDGIPVHSTFGLLLAMAIRPTAFRDWPNVKKWLPGACARVVKEMSLANNSIANQVKLFELLNEQPANVIARLSYFFRISDQKDFAQKLLERIPTEFEGPVYLGQRKSKNVDAKYDALTKVYDSLIISK
jgi:predicted nucleic acid-binding protein